MDDYYSPRLRRIERANKSKSPALNLVALMDIFTILVFFLLVNSSNVQQSPSDLLKLPQARVNTQMEESLLIQVNTKNISVQGRKIIDVSDVLNDKRKNIPDLLKELEYQFNRSRDKNTSDKSVSQSIRIMGDQKISFKLLKKIMLTASEANYIKVSFVVISTPLNKK